MKYIHQALISSFAIGILIGAIYHFMGEASALGGMTGAIIFLTIMSKKL